MVCAPVRSIIPSLKLGDYLSVQAHKPCSISHVTDPVKQCSNISMLCEVIMELLLDYAYCLIELCFTSKGKLFLNVIRC